MHTPFRVRGRRYQTRDVDRAVAFYTGVLGFTLKHQQGSAFASVSCDGLDVLLSGPHSSGARPMPNGEAQSPSGWIRLVLAVNDLPALIETLKARGSAFRNELLAGPGGRQVQLLDPDGNPIELFEPAASGAACAARADIACRPAAAQRFHEHRHRVGTERRRIRDVQRDGVSADDKRARLARAIVASGLSTSMRATLAQADTRAPKANRVR